MNEEEVRKIIDNMSEQELNDFIFFALQEVEKENQKLKTELENKDKEIQFQKEINKTEQNRHKQTEKSLKGQLKKKDKMIDLMGEKIFEEGIVWENKEDVKQYYERKVENGN